MDGDLAGYLVVLALGTALTIADGQILIRAGRGFLADVFESRETASSLSTMLVAFFHLLVLGVLALVSTVDVGAENFVELVVRKMGWVLLILALAHGITMIILARLRRQWREQQLIAEAVHPEGGPPPASSPPPPSPRIEPSNRSIDVAPPQW
jgi:hypothetical protein